MGFFKTLAGFFDRGRSAKDLARWLDLPEGDLRDWLNGRPPDPRGRDYYYNEFTIPKRRGGSRTIHAPSDGLKSLQRRILHRLLNPLPMPAAATGFVPGRSILDNARPHVASGVVINIDLAEFFPSISSERIQDTFQALGWGRQAATILANVCTREGRLPQGAPTSPALSNLVCRKLDARLSALAEKPDGRYTRYADDLTFSFAALGRTRRHAAEEGDAVGRQVLTQVRKIIEDEGFKIQMKKKVRVQRCHQRQTTTGLVVNSKINLPREVRRRVRAMQHHERLGRLDSRAKRRLRGWEGLLAMVASIKQ